MRYLILLLTAQPLLGLVVNGSFEDPVLLYTQNLVGPFTLPGWTGTGPSDGGNAGLVVGPNNGLTPAHGLQHFTFNGGNPSDRGYLEQTLATTPGTTYAVTFALGRAGGGQTLSLTASAGGSSQTFQPPTAPGYLLHTLDFTALNPATTLRFTDTSGPNSISDLYLDAISVHAVPEPSTPADLLIALGALLLAIRRRA